MTFRFPGKMNDFVRKFIRGIFGEKNKENDCGKRRKNLIGILVMPKWFLMIPWHRCHSCRLKLDL